MKERNAPSVCMCLVTGTRYPQYVPAFRFSALFQLTKAKLNEWLKTNVKMHDHYLISSEFYDGQLNTLPKRKTE